MLTRIKIFPVACCNYCHKIKPQLENQSVSKTSETTNRMIFTETKILVHFYKKNSQTSSSFSMTFRDFPGRVVTLPPACMSLKY